MTQSGEATVDRDLLRVNDLTLDYATVDQRVRVLQNVSLHVKKGEILGVVGESGSGKTTLGLSIIRLLDSPPADIIGGSITFEEKDLLKLNPTELSQFRGPGIGMVFQESLGSSEIRFTELIHSLRNRLKFFAELRS